MSENQEAVSKPIVLSKYTLALIDSVKNTKEKSRPDEISKLSVSQTVSFFALVYEKVRNAVEYREDHLILRAAIERILSRRFALNPEGKGEAENIIRELLWARYFDNESLGAEDVVKVQHIIDTYISIRRKILQGRDSSLQEYLGQFLFSLVTCEIEEILNPIVAQRALNFTFFAFQVLRNKIKIEGITEEQRDAYFLAALEKFYRRSDKAHQRYHLFRTFYRPLYQYKQTELQDLSAKLPEIFQKIDNIIQSPYIDGLSRFTKKQLPPFLILFSLFKSKFEGIGTVLTDKNKLWIEVESMCREKYQQTGLRLRNLAIRSFIYIFLTKMIFALILEYPVSLYLFGEVNNVSVLVNSIFPPILMLLIVTFFKLPTEENTEKIYQRIIEIIDADESFETKTAFIPKKPRERKPLLIFGFTVFYSLTFLITLILIYEGLSLLNFNLVSQAVFIFFVSVVTFFSYRIKQISNEYKLAEKESILTPIVDFFFMPILSMGKFFSNEIAKLNFFIFIFDFLIEAPFKLVFEVVEEWISFVKRRKEEII